MKSKFALTIFLVSVFLGTTWAREDSLARNVVFLELGGASGHLSLNYDRIVRINERIGLEVGIGFSPCLLDKSGFSPRLPIQAKFYRKFKRHLVEIGGAVTPYIWYNQDNNLQSNFKNITVAFFGQLGYKYLFKNNRYSLGGAFMPMFWDINQKYFQPWGALRLGYNF